MELKLKERKERSKRSQHRGKAHFSYAMLHYMIQKFILYPSRGMKLVNRFFFSFSYMIYLVLFFFVRYVISIINKLLSCASSLPVSHSFKFSFLKLPHQLTTSDLISNQITIRKGPSPIGYSPMKQNTLK